MTMLSHDSELAMRSWACEVFQTRLPLLSCMDLHGMQWSNLDIDTVSAVAQSKSQQMSAAVAA